MKIKKIISSGTREYLLSKSVIWPFIIRDFSSLNEEDHAANLQLAFDVSENEFGFRPFTSAEELSQGQELDKTRMITYLSKFYELFRGTPLPASGSWLSSVGLSCVLHLQTVSNRAFQMRIFSSNKYHWKNKKMQSKACYELKTFSFWWFFLGIFSTTLPQSSSSSQTCSRTINVISLHGFSIWLF